MAYVVTDSCIQCKYTDCVAVCPVDCFHEGENMLVIHPDDCIDCGACESECPTTAIFEELDLPDKKEVFININAFFSGSTPGGQVPNDMHGWPAHLIAAAREWSASSGGNGIWPVIDAQQEPLPSADASAHKSDKLQHLSPRSA